MSPNSHSADALTLPIEDMQPCSPVPELSFLPAPYRGWTRVGEKRVQDNLHVHAQNEPIKHHQTLLGPNHAARVNVSRNAFLSWRSKKNHFIWRWYCGKKHKNVKIEICFIAVCALNDNEYTSYFFSQTIFKYCFGMLSEFAKVFERKLWRVQVAHLHNQARALWSPSSRCFQLSTNLGKDFFRYLWYCGKKQIECV